MKKAPMVKVLYIVGVERSGSTICQNVFAQIENFFAVGELRFIWDQALLEGRPCGCGVAVDQCPAWSAILEETFGETIEEQITTMAALNRKVRDRFSPIIFLPGHRWFLQKRLGTYIANLGKLYRAIQEQTDCRVIVDASKSLFYAYLLSTIPSIDLYIIHLVRDVRGVEYSLQKRKASGHPRLQQYSTIRGALTWLALNSLIEFLGRAITTRVLRIRYEDFISQPQQYGKDILRFIGESESIVPVADDGSIDLQPTHTIVGSPSRFHTGNIKLELDALWRDLLPWSKKRLVSALALPLLIRYQYLGHSKILVRS
ncbi:MAG: sulfotransferase [Caldilineaceae bacterium]|nr:sulfotransferase [Caldilineaceae bacterium]